MSALPSNTSIDLRPFTDTKEDSKLMDVADALNKFVGPVSLLVPAVFAVDHFACWQGTPFIFKPGSPLHLAKTKENAYTLCHHITIPGVPNGGKDLREASIVDVANVLGTVMPKESWTVHATGAVKA